MTSYIDVNFHELHNNMTPQLYTMTSLPVSAKTMMQRLEQHMNSL